MKAIILAAGRGSRMENLTDECPKCLLRVRGRTLLDWQLEALSLAGVTEIALVTGYKRELLRVRGLKEFHNIRWMETNMVSSLECADQWLSSEPCIVSYSDIFYETQAVSSLIECPSDLAVTYDPKWRRLWEKRFIDPLLDAETFRLSTKGELLEIGGKAKSVEEIEGQYMGLLRFTPKGWEEVVRVRSTLTGSIRDKMHLTGTLQLVIDGGRMQVGAVSYSGEWGEFDSASDLVGFI